MVAGLLGLSSDVTLLLGCRLARLARLTADSFLLVADSLALIWFGSRTARISAATSPTRCLSMPLTVILVGAGTSNSMPGPGFNLDRMRIANGQHERLTGLCRAIANPFDLQVFAESLGDSLDRVGQ